MKKSTKKFLINILIIVIVILLALFILNKPSPQTSEEVAKCIGENSVLYVQLGCSHCEDQEEMFGENAKYIEIVDCFFEKDICIEKEIPATPTWIINGEEYVGVQSISKLQEITGCN